MDRSSRNAAVGTILGVLAVVAAGLFLYFTYWAGHTDSTNRQQRLDQHSYGNQTSLQNTADQKILELNTITDPGTKTAETTEICMVIARIDSSIKASDTTIGSFETNHCSGN